MIEDIVCVTPDDIHNVTLGYVQKASMVWHRRSFQQVMSSGIHLIQCFENLCFENIPTKYSLLPREKMYWRETRAIIPTEYKNRCTKYVILKYVNPHDYRYILALYPTYTYSMCFISSIIYSKQKISLVWCQMEYHFGPLYPY